ncbi:hypothetical protein [Serratia odorifera]|uniref:Uncharacterized protein n=2 Tax=Serratia odorifera TaxID=618 RepID=D4E7G5_SEROD|nr:hypothetical protein [Serratia odorifera]EFE94020.1 hypothetical protein HMPREF0758_4115 [Serratia odorifera DSM 4582]PNK89106.1 hypothetical protein CEQ31_005005 [Serratia odorifera]RII69864.1 hypothetical protein DX901_21290 [Serratia odorifera]VDZ64162.1 Uncharacterised protein [Serratia odorifera]
MISNKQLLESLPFNGRVVIEVKDGDIISIVTIPDDHLIASLDVLRELLERAGYAVHEQL